MKKVYSFVLAFSISILGASAQNMGIGTATPNEKLDVQGAIKIGNTTANNAGTIRYDATAQKFQVNIAGAWYDVATGTAAAITSITYNATTNEITVLEGSNTYVVNLSDLQDNTDNQTITLSGNTLTISNGNNVDLSSFLDNTDNQTLSLSTNTLSISGGNNVSLAPYSQTLSLASNNLSISGGNSVSLLPYLDNTDAQNLSLSGNTLNISSGTGVSLASFANTDNQALSYNTTTNVLSLTNGGTVDLTDLQDNTDAQNLSLSGNTLNISGGTGVSLASFANTDNQTLSLNTNTLAISGGNSVSLSPYLDNTDAQTLSLSGSTLSITGGNSVSLASFVDTDDQTLSQVYQEGGNNVQLTAADGDVRFYRGTNTEVLTMRESTGFVGMGTSNPLANLNIVSTYETTLLNLMRTTLDKSGLLMTTEYGTDVYSPGFFWNTNNNNSDKPKAGIFLQLSAAGSRMIFGTSNSYATGITNSALTINESANIIMSSLAGSGNVLVTANNTGQVGKTALSGNSTDVYTGAGTFTSINSLLPSDWTRSGNNLYPSSTAYNVGIGTTAPARKLHVEGGGQISLLQSGTVATDSQAGIYWHTNTDYGIYRSAGAWSGNYQQLTAKWVTGIVLDPGTAYGKSYVDITGGGLRVTAGTVGIGTTAPEANLHLRDATPTIRISSTSSGASALSQNSPGLELTSNGTNATSKYTPMIKFGSTDPQFTTSNPKFSAGIVGRATETYGSDTDGGMALDFAVSPNDPGATPVPSVEMTLTHNGNLGIGTTNPDEKLEVNGYIKSKGVINTDGTVTDSEVIAKRYHVVSRYGTNTRSTVALDMTIINELCGDEDGCIVRGLMRRWSNNTQTQAATRGPYVFTYNDADGHWRLYDNEGIDGSGGTQHVWQWWDCYLTDGVYSNGSNLGDPGKGLGLLNWNSDYSNASKTCEITFED